MNFLKPKTVAAAIANLTKAQAEADAAKLESKKALAVANKLREITEAE